MSNADELVRKVTYTASLATRAEDIDPMLDTLRVVTSKLGPGDSLTAEDEAKLADLQRQLETHLLTEEKLRFFTPESLRLQVERHMRGEVSKKSRRQLLVVTAVAATIAAGAAILLPLGDIQQRTQVGGATMFSLLTVGAASLFLTALPAFQSQLRRAFLLICAAVTILGLGLLAQPVLEIFDLRQYPATSVLYSLPILISGILFHTGDALYVRLVGARSWWTTPAPVIIAALILSPIVWVLPHIPTNEPELVHRIVALFWLWLWLTPIASAVVLPMAVRRLPELYKPAIRYLWLAMFPTAAVVGYQFVLRVVAGPYMEGAVSYVLFALVILMALALVRAGYEFNKVDKF